MSYHAPVFGVLFLVATLFFTYWITWISLANDAHGPQGSMDPDSSSS